MPNWHIDLIAEYLLAVQRGEIKRLIINMPPRALKSVCVSVAWPAWLLGHAPDSRILAASYASGLSLKHSLDCRVVLQSPWYQRIFPETRLVRGQNAREKFVTTARGYRLATSLGASVVGEGGNTLIVDDPLSPLQAMNAKGREHAQHWFEQTFASRLDNKNSGVMVLVMQRLHANDLSGFLLEKGGWEHLMLPALATQNTLHDFGSVFKKRVSGTALHAGRESKLLLARAKQELGSHAFAAQYQQQPIPEEGGMLRKYWLKRYSQLPFEPERHVQSWDTAIKSGAHHDASVCLTFAEKEGLSYLIDVQVLRLEYPQLKKAVVELANLFKPEVVLMEDKASGQQLLQDLKREAYLPLVPATAKRR